MALLKCIFCWSGILVLFRSITCKTNLDLVRRDFIQNDIVRHQKDTTAVGRKL